MNRLFLLLPLWVYLAAAPPGYAPLGQSHGVAVFRQLSGPGVGFYAEGELTGSPEQVAGLLLDYEHQPSFLRHVAESRILRRQEDTLWVYQRLKLPVLADRDFTLKVAFGKTGDTQWIRFACDNQSGPPPRRGVVRLSLNEGSWLLDPANSGHATHARYQVRMDLRAALPGWIVRSKAAKEIPALFETLRQKLR